MEKREREVLSEFLGLYCSLSCLWDIGSEFYKDKNKKVRAWQLLAEKLHEIDPEGVVDVTPAKKKIENMRTAYKREEKKIKESKRTGSGESEVHVPNLWYYNLLSPVFSNKDEQNRTGVESLTRDEDSYPSQTGKIPQDRALRGKKHKLTEPVAVQELLQKGDKKPNSFGVYVGEQLEQVDIFQRQVAEKLISDVLFLAKTGNLQFETKIDSPCGSRGSFYLNNNNSQSKSPSPRYIIQSSPSPQYVPPSPLPVYIRSSPSAKYVLTSASPKHMQSSPSPKYIRSPSPQYCHTSSSPQRQLFQPSSASQTIATKQDETIIQLSIVEGDPLYSTPTEENHPHTTTTPKSQYIPSPSPEYILSSHSEDEGIIQLSLRDGGPSLDNIPSEENQTSRIINHEGPANSLLKELLISKNI